MKKAINVTLAALFMVGTVNIAMAECSTEGSPITHTPGLCIRDIWTPNDPSTSYCDTTLMGSESQGNLCWKEIIRT
mgnify:CR=1 FL=1